MNWTALIVFTLLFGLITVMGFVAAHWRRGDLSQLHEWGLAGRRLGTVITWFPTSYRRRAGPTKRRRPTIVSARAVEW